MLIFPVFIPQKGCPFNCIYCSQEQFDSVQELPFGLLAEQIRGFCRFHRAQEKQIAFYGGTFTGLSIEEREKYYQLVEPHLDEKTSLRISTRPDCVGEEKLNWCKDHHIKTIELGIQDFNDEVLNATARGYDSQTAIAACKRVKQYGFELGIQLMPGLPHATQTSYIESAQILHRLKPRYLRIYPLIVLSRTKLWDDFKNGSYTPLSLDEAIGLCADYWDLAEHNKIRIIKTGIPSLAKDAEFAGPYHPAFGELVKGEFMLRKIVRKHQGEQYIRVSNKDISLFTGHDAFTWKKLRKRLNSCTKEISPDSTLAEGEFRFAHAH